VCLVALAIALPVAPIEAHSAAVWYGGRWQSRTVDWRFDNDFPKSGGIRQAVIKGSRQWNHAGANLQFHFHSRDRESHNLDPCSQPAGRNFVGWGPIDGAGGKLAVTVTCTFGEGTGPRDMHAFLMILDSDETWHTNPSTQPGPFDTDVWAVASHEFGHAGGRITGGPGNQGHFSENSRLCPDILNDRRHTMCPSYDVIGAVMRTLERHDIDTFRNAYGER
jgi:hypothetical protein